MSESVKITTPDDAIKHENHGRKRVRHRKKLLYEKILKQMEFYFSDANLTKDRFLGDLVKNDPFVPIEVFLKFNKIRSMTQDVIDIGKAMKYSTILELSEDKLKIRRRTAVLPYDADQRTVYVESIPVTASREWLERIFSDYGHVAYISLPKFKDSQTIKGYGFIEFEKPEDAQKCLLAFTKMGCKLPTCMPPEDLSSIKMFSVEETEEVENKVKDEEEPPKKKTKKKDKRPKNLELKPGQDSDSERKDTPTDEIKRITTPTEEDLKLSLLNQECRTTDVESKEELTGHEESKDSPTNKNNRKRKAKSKRKSKPGIGANEAPKGALWGLQVLPKSEWKALRNKYLNLQRKYMKELKANHYNKKYAYSDIPDPDTPLMEAETAAKGKYIIESYTDDVMEKSIKFLSFLSIKDFTPAQYVWKSSCALNPQKIGQIKTVVPLEKIPGVFVREMLPEPCYNVRQTKQTVKTNIHALHVDAKEAQSEIIIRFDSAKAADEYCANSCSRASVLCGAEEEQQWRRAAAARGGVRLRGRARPRPHPVPASPQPTHTHIRFDD